MRMSTFAAMVFASLLAGGSSPAEGSVGPAGGQADDKGDSRARRTVSKAVSTRPDKASRTPGQGDPTA